MHIRREIAFAAGLVSVLVASRAIYAPKYLVNFDAVNFALAIREFNPGMHQPQPPGYPLFVLLLKSLDLILQDARRDLLVAGLIGSIAAVLLLWGFARDMFGEPVGYLSALVLAVHPLFWYAGLANPVRIYLALISISTAWAGWRCLSTESARTWLLVMGGTLGVLSGFRPETVLLLAPLFVAVGLRARVTWLAFVMAALLMVACAGSWISVLAYKAGGFRPFLELYFGYLGANSRDYTLLFGAPPSAALETVRRTVAWNFIPALPWAWALILAWPRLASATSGGRGFLLTCWFLPSFLFHAFVHVRDLDQTLVTAPVVCLVGGWALANLTRQRWRFVIPAAAMATIALSVYWFRRPPMADVKLASSGTIRFSNDWMRSTFAALDTVRKEGSFAIVCYGSVVTWRQISYYYPDTPVLYLPGTENGSQAVSPFWVLHSHTTAAEDPISLPDGSSIAWSVAPGPEGRAALAQIASTREVGPLAVMRITEGSRFHLWRWNFIVSSDRIARRIRANHE